MEGSKAFVCRSVSRSCAHVSRDTTEDEYIKLHGISKRKELRHNISKMGNMKYQYRSRSFWCKGYYVDTVGKNTKAISEYISHQLKEDELGSQLTLAEPDPFTGSK